MSPKYGDVSQFNESLDARPGSQTELSSYAVQNVLSPTLNVLPLDFSVDYLTLNFVTCYPEITSRNIDLSAFTYPA